MVITRRELPRTGLVGRATQRIRGSSSVAALGPVERVPGGAGLVANLQLARIAQLPEQPADRLRTVGDGPQRSGLVSAFRHRYGDRFRVHIHAYKSGTFA